MNRVINISIASWAVVQCLVVREVRAASVNIGSSPTSWGGTFVQVMQDAIDWAVGPGLSIVIVCGVLIGLTLWNLAPKTGALAMAIKAVACATLAVPVIAFLLSVKDGGGSA